MLKIICLHLFVFALFLPGQACAASVEMPSGAKVFTFGNYKVIALQDLPVEMERAIFTGAGDEVIDSVWAKADPSNSGKVPASVNVFVVCFDDKIILIDCGVPPGAKKDTLPELLKQTGIEPDVVDAVLITHMHFDHIGGLLDADGKPAFARAAIYVSAPEKNFWQNEDARNAAPDARKPNFELAVKVLDAYADRVQAFESDAEAVFGMKIISADGHTPGNAVYLLDAGENKILFWGDTVHAAAVQFAMPEICALYDMNIEKAVQDRRAFMNMAVDQKLVVAGAHLPFPGLITVQKQGEGFAFTPY
jgi:glyoxylase-like metal-dependent hydrolase (beta-lactamase superfamily II)